MIQIHNLTKSFGPLPVLQGLDLTLAEGRVTALVGPNGAGKTTLIKCILGLTRPDGGHIDIDGHTLNGDWSYRAHVGYMPQLAHFPDNLTGRELIRLVKDLRGNPEAVDETLVRDFDLEAELDKPVRTLSGGTRQKVSAVLAFLFDPQILILDEPTAGLDPVASSRFKDHILEARQRGKTIILTSHIMSEIDELADHLVFLLEGKVWFEGAIKGIKDRMGEERLERAVARLLNREAA